jgi:hypothetical protein
VCAHLWLGFHVAVYLSIVSCLSNCQLTFGYLVVSVEFAKFMTQILQKLGVPVKAALAQKMSEMVVTSQQKSVSSGRAPY